jgi:predicted secreted hydrolase
MRTSGTLVVDGKKHQIKGSSWLDRQWGEMPTSLTRWTWMNLGMPNGDKIAIWDTVEMTGEWNS